MYQMSDLKRIQTALLVLVTIFSVTYAASSASSYSSTPRKSRGSTPNEIEQWPDLVVDLPSFGRQVIIDPRNASQNASRQSQPRKSNRRADPDINDIISGLVKLLGGQANVHVAELERRKHDGEPSHSNSASSTRINNRGPPSLSDLPPGLPPGLISGNDEPIVKNQRVPPGQLRPPPGPPRGGPPQQNGFLLNNNRPRPVVRPQQQRPPPQQQQLPTSGKVRFPNDNIGPVAPPPFSSGVPIPEQLVPLQRPPGNLIPFPRPSTTTTTTTTTTTEPTTIELEPSEQEITTVDTEPSPEQKFSLSSPSSSSTSTSSIQPTPPLATTSSTSSWTIVNEIKDDEEGQLRPGVVFDEESVIGPDSAQEVVDVITAGGSVYPSAPGDVFDVTVSANQGFGGASVDGGSKRPVFVPVADHHEDDIISSPIAKDGQQHDFVSIDGRKTYFNLLPTEVVDPSGTIRTENTAQTIGPPPPTPSPPPPAIREEVSPGVGIGTGFIRPLPPVEASEILANANANANNSNGPGGIRRRPPAPPSVGASRPPGVRGGDVVHGGQEEVDSSTRRPFTRRPAAPPVRIDTCIVGDDTTCKAEENESCRTVFGVSSCYCRPGYARKRHREPCKTVSSLLISLKVDRMDSRKVSWHFALGDPDSEDYQRLEYEAEHALETILKKTPYKPFFIRSDINNFYPLGSRVIVNATVRLESNPMTTTTKVRHELRKHITAAIKQSPAAINANQPQQESSKLGDSLLAVDGLLNAIPQLGDFNECLDPKANDCDEHSECENTFGSFTCKCKPGYVDKDPNNKARAGRKCQTCSPTFCNNRGDCVVKNGAQVCQCRGSYFGERCEMDGEVVGVAVGASVAAVIIIVLTLVFLCLWSRKWKREQAKTDYAHTFTFVNPGLSGLAVLSQRLGMNGAAAGHGGAKTGPPPYRMNTMDGDRMHPGYHTDPSGGHGTLIPSLSQNVYAQPEPMMPKRSHTPNSLYATSNVAMPANAMYHQQKQQPQHHLHQQQQHGQSSKFMSLKKDSNGFGFGNRSTPLSFGESSEDDFEDSDVLTARVGGSNKGMIGGGGGGGAYNIPMIGSGLRPKSRTSHLAKSQNGHFYEADYSQYHGGDIYSSRGGTLTQPAIPMATYTQNIRPFYS